MLSVSQTTKDLFKSDSVHKEMVVNIYVNNSTHYTFTNSLIYSESFELSETILDGSDMTFMGCISNEMRITLRNVHNLREDAFDKSKITVSVTPYYLVNGVSTAADTVPLFTGYVESGNYDQDKSWLKITAYDVLYFLRGFNVWNWYRSEFSSGSQNLDVVLNHFVDYIHANSGYSPFEMSDICPVILSDVKIKKQLTNKQMTATDFLKSFCQLACCMAIIDRAGKLKLVYLGPTTTQDEFITYYRSATSKDYIVRPFAQGITIRTNSDDNGVTLTTKAEDTDTMPTASSSNVGKVYHYIGTTTSSYTYDHYYVCEQNNSSYSWVDTGWNDDSNDDYIVDEDDVDVTTGRYFIENNGLVKKLSKKKRTTIIGIDLANVQNSYYTFKSYNVECNGLPYLECGDRIGYKSSAEREVTENFSYSQDTVTIDNSNSSERIPLTVTFTFNTQYTNIYSGYNPMVIYNMTQNYSSPNRYVYLNISGALAFMGFNSIEVDDKLEIFSFNNVFTMYYYRNNVRYDISTYTPSTPCELCLEPNTAENKFIGNFAPYIGWDGVIKYTTHAEQILWQHMVVNRRLKGIQAMVDTFSFDLDNTLKQYGGTTSGLTDTNIAAESSTTSEQLTGEEVMTVVSFVNGVLTTTSKKI